MEADAEMDVSTVDETGAVHCKSKRLKEDGPSVHFCSPEWYRYLDEYGLKSFSDHVGICKGYELVLPKEHESVSCAPTGLMPVYREALQGGLRFPLHDLLIALFTAYYLTLAQVVPNTWPTILSFIAVCELRGLPCNVETFRRVHRVQRAPHGGWFMVCNREGFMSAKDKPTAIKKWKNEFVYVRSKTGWPIKTTFGTGRELLEGEFALCAKLTEMEKKTAEYFRYKRVEGAAGLIKMPTHWLPNLSSFHDEEFLSACKISSCFQHDLILEKLRSQKPSMVGELTAEAILIAQAKKKAAKKAQKATQKKGQAVSIIRIKHPTHPASITSDGGQASSALLAHPHSSKGHRSKSDNPQNKASGDLGRKHVVEPPEQESASKKAKHPTPSHPCELLHRRLPFSFEVVPPGPTDGGSTMGCLLPSDPQERERALAGLTPLLVPQGRINPPPPNLSNEILSDAMACFYEFGARFMKVVWAADHSSSAVADVMKLEEEIITLRSTVSETEKDNETLSSSLIQARKDNKRLKDEKKCLEEERDKALQELARERESWKDKEKKLAQQAVANYRESSEYRDILIGAAIEQFDTGVNHAVRIFEKAVVELHGTDAWHRLNDRYEELDDEAAEEILQEEFAKEQCHLPPP